jgi:hypothetical protein
VGSFALVSGAKREILKSAQPKLEKHLGACFVRDTGFLVALAKSAFAEIAIWFGLWLISPESHHKSLAKQPLSQIGSV